MYKLSVGERVSSDFEYNPQTYYGTVVALQRGMPAVKFDEAKLGTRKMSRSNCLLVEKPLVEKLIAAIAAELPWVSTHQRHLVEANRSAFGL